MRQGARELTDAMQKCITGLKNPNYTGIYPRLCVCTSQKDQRLTAIPTFLYKVKQLMW